MYRFALRAIAVDRSGYYYPRWDRAQSLEVIAADRDAAMTEAVKVLGDHGRGRGWGWTFQFDSITPVNS